jgi:HEAT repeat protein
MFWRQSLFKSLACLVTGVWLAASAAAQVGRAPARPTPRPTAAVSADEAGELSSGWALLAKADAPRASAVAAALLERHPRSVAVLALAVEADIMGVGAPAALDRYERWLGARSIEEPAVLRRVARAFLFEALGLHSDPAARSDAWKSLVQDGETLPALVGASPASGDLLAATAAGDAAAARQLLQSLPSDSGSRVRVLDAVSAGEPKVEPGRILPLLQDPRSEVRAAAAQALGAVGGQETAAALKPLLADTSLFVRAKAAAALLRTGDVAGLPVLEEMAAAENAAIRLEAASGLASRPDARWLSLVRELASNPNPEIRIGAARLAAPHDPALARSVLDGVANDENPAIRELAALASGDVAPALDLPTLRRLLRQSLAVARVRAAAGILAAVR